MASPLIQLVLLVTVVTAVRCQGDCYLDDEPTVENARNYIQCLRHQLSVIENEITTDNSAAFEQGQSKDKQSFLPAKQDLSTDEYDLFREQKDSAGGHVTELLPVGSYGQFAVNYDDVKRFPDCQGLSADQCTSLLAFLEETAMSLPVPDDDVIDGAVERTGDDDAIDFRSRRSVSFNSVNKLKMAHLKSKKLQQQLDPVMVKNIKTLIRWQIQNGGGALKNTPKFKGRWGRSVGHVSGADQSAISSLALLREKRNAMRALLMANINSLSPKVRQMLADYLIWKAKNPGFIKLTSRHG